jgi:predicted amino acid dehydrogenase
MENEKKIDPETMTENMEAARRFISDIAKSGQKNGIPPAVAVTVLGLFSRAVVQMYMADGMSKEEATREVVTDFTDGLGIKAIFRLSAKDGGKPH